MKAAVINSAGDDFSLEEREIPSPKENEVLIKVDACGICHSDNLTKEATFPGLELPRVPGHEVIGKVEGTGDNVNQWKKGQRVGVGWHGGHCFECEPCRRGDFINCKNAKVSGVSYDGGYAEYMTAPKEAIVEVPEKMNAAEAAPLLCAGITVYNGIRNSGIRPGDVVAVQGIGGLGHLAIQYASKMGMQTVAISHSADKKDLAEKMGAQHFVDSSEENPAKALQKLGGAKLIVGTAPKGDAMSQVVNGLGTDGKLLAIAVTGETVEVSPMQLIAGRKSVSGWPSGTPIDSEDTLKFSQMTGTKPMIEEYPLEKVNEAFDRMMNNEARFRVVLKM